MLVAIYKENDIPLVFSRLPIKEKLKTKFLNNITQKFTPASDDFQAFLDLEFIPKQEIKGLNKYSFRYHSEEVSSKTGKGNFVPLIMVLQSDRGFLYLARTFIRFHPIEPAIKPNQLKLFTNKE